MSNPQICTAEWMVSGASGVGLSSAWLPRLVTERFVPSVRDGAVDRTPDPIPFIDAELSWTNTTGTDQHVNVSVHKASRSLVTSSPNTLVLDDAIAWSVARNPKVPAPVAAISGAGTRLKTTQSRSSAMKYGRLYTDFDDHIDYVHIGRIAPGYTLQFRYRCLFSTPGEWRAALQPKHEAYARWARLRLWASPHVGGI